MTITRINNESLCAIADSYLHFSSELKVKSQLKDPQWIEHEIKFNENCSRLIEEGDTLVLVKDYSWGKDISECEKDLMKMVKINGVMILKIF